MAVARVGRAFDTWMAAEQPVLDLAEVTDVLVSDLDDLRAPMGDVVASVRLDRRGIVTDAKRTRSILGFWPRDLIGERLADLLHPDPADCERSLNLYRELTQQLFRGERQCYRAVVAHVRGDNHQPSQAIVAISATYDHAGHAVGLLVRYATIDAFG